MTALLITSRISYTPVSDMWWHQLVVRLSRWEDLSILAASINYGLPPVKPPCKTSIFSSPSRMFLAVLFDYRLVSLLGSIHISLTLAVATSIVHRLPQLFGTGAVLDDANYHWDSRKQDHYTFRSHNYEHFKFKICPPLICTCLGSWY